jgi:hypothetical protein
LLDALDTIGPPKQCIWRAVGLSAVLPTDVERIQTLCRQARESLATAPQLATRLSGVMRIKPPRTLAEAAQLVKLCSLIETAPAMDRRRLADPVWDERRNDIGELVGARSRLGCSEGGAPTGCPMAVHRASLRAIADSRRTGMRYTMPALGFQRGWTGWSGDH